MRGHWPDDTDDGDDVTDLTVNADDDKPETDDAAVETRMVTTAIGGE